MQVGNVNGYDVVSEIWCDKCGFHNWFTHDPAQHVEKSEEPPLPLVDAA